MAETEKRLPGESTEVGTRTDVGAGTDKGVTKAYDLIVIGSGPAGEKGAAQVAYFGKKVAMVEKNVPDVGGACVHTGTLPSKCLRESALYFSGLRTSGIK